MRKLPMMSKFYVQVLDALEEGPLQAI
jgi:hypothetical protein